MRTCCSIGTAARPYKNYWPSWSGAAFLRSGDMDCGSIPRWRMRLPRGSRRPRVCHRGPLHEVRFDEMLITGDLELEKLNDEELFAAATTYFAAEDYRAA